MFVVRIQLTNNVEASVEAIQDGGSIPPASILKELKMFEIKFKNGVTVTVCDAIEDPRNWGVVSENDPTLYIASASHDKTGPIQVTSFEKRYTDTEDEDIVFGLEPDELPRFLAKSCSMRFTEEGEQCIAFFDF